MVTGKARARIRRLVRTQQRDQYVNLGRSILAHELRQFVSSLLNRHAPPAFLYEIDPRLGAADFSQSWSEPELEGQPEPERVDAALLTRLRALPPGTWFEFGARSGERAKLSWTSPFSGRCLFVNREDRVNKSSESGEEAHKARRSFRRTTRPLANSAEFNQAL